MTGLYDSDFYAWTQSQAAALRAVGGQAGGGQAGDLGVAAVDWEHLAEEIEDMGRSQAEEIENRLTTLLEHLIKLRFSPDAAPRGGWRRTIVEQRRMLRKRLEQNPSLRRWPQTVLAECWADACENIAADQSVQGAPATCPFDLETEILARDWFPSAPTGPQA